MTPNPHNPQPYLTQQPAPLPIRTFRRSTHAHHDQIQRRHKPVRVLIGDHKVVDQHRGPAFHDLDQLSEDISALGVGPVVEDGVQEVESGACERERIVSGGLA